MDQATKDLKEANRLIAKRHRYFCGLVNEEKKQEIGCGDFFFESPDGQCGELYSELLKLGYKTKMYNAPYYWKVWKIGIEGSTIAYTEGDISIY